MIVEAKKSDIETLVKLVELKGTLPDGKAGPLNDFFLLVAKNGELRVVKPDVTASVMITVGLKRANIKDEGIMPVGDIQEFKDFLKRMGKNITISYDHKTITLFDGIKKSSFQATSEDIELFEQSIVKKTDDGFYEMATDASTKLGTTFEVMATALKSVSDDGNLVGVRVFPIDVSENGLKVSVGEPQSSVIESKIDIVNFQGAPTKSQYAYGFDNIFANIGGLVKVTLGENTPMVVEMEEGDLYFQAVIAPRL